MKLSSTNFIVQRVMLGNILAREPGRVDVVYHTRDLKERLHCREWGVIIFALIPQSVKILLYLPYIFHPGFTFKLS